MNILIIGHARHGKDTFAELLNQYFGMTFLSSSIAASEIFLYDKLKHKYGYSSPEECFSDRVNHRDEWYQEICNYNLNDKARLAKDILKKADCYVGMRDNLEFKSCKEQNIFDLIIWVDASGRLPLEPETSFNISKSESDIIIDNNGDLEQLKNKTKRLGRILMKKDMIDFSKDYLSEELKKYDKLKFKNEPS